MIVHVARVGGGVYHARGVSVIRDWGGSIEVARASESPAVFRYDEISSMRIDPEDRICSASAAAGIEEGEPPRAA